MATKQDKETALAQLLKETALAQLREWIKPGDTVYTVMRHVSKSGMQREIGVVLIKQGEDKPVILHPNYSVSIALNMPLGKRDSVKVRGCGMDMGFHLVDCLSYALFNRGGAIYHQWI